MSDDLIYLMSEVKKRHDEAQTLMDSVKGLVGKTSKRTTTYMLYLEATCRRNYYSLFSLYHLSDIQLNWFGSAALDISRQMIEDMISIEWMELKDPERQSKKMYRFQAIERYLNLEQSKRLGVDPSAHLSKADIEKIVTEFESVKKEFSNKNGALYHNYNHQSVDTMITELEGKINPEILSKESLERITYWYIEGNKKNHFNADDILWYLEDENSRDLQLARSLERSLFIGINTFSQICLRYIDEIINKGGGIPDVDQIRALIVEQAQEV